jgi:superfamily II DNA or RNA helicase
VLSATVADKIKYFAPVGYVLGWINDCSKYAVWLNKKAHDTGFPKSKTLHHLIFPFHGSRMKISELGDLFPRNQVIAECYDMENAKEIEAQYEIIKKCIEDLRQKKNDTGCILAKITRARQMIELLKYPTFCELIEDHLDSGLSVVVFVNYTDTLNKLAKTFETGSVIHGQQTETERNKIIDAFQRNETNLIIANIKAGGVGISLHDIHGGHQRVSIISPTWSAQDTVQTLGRIHRAEGKTPALQKFVFCSGTIEEYICDKLREKLDTLSTINDGLLHPYSNLMIVPDSDEEDNGNTSSDTDSESDSVLKSETFSDSESISKSKINLNKASKKVKQTKQLKEANSTQSKSNQLKPKRKVKSAGEYLDV